MIAVVPWISISSGPAGRCRETLLARGVGGDAGAGAAGLRGDARPLPHFEPDRMVVHQLGDADIHALPKQRVVVDGRGVAGKIDG